MSQSFKKGDRVAYTTTGRYPKDIVGTVVSFETLNGWYVVKGDDGKERKTRQSTLRSA